MAADPGEADLVRLCERVRDVGWGRVLKAAAVRRQKRFPRNPFFPYFEAMYHLGQSQPYGPAAWKVEPLLEKARRLAEAAPPDDANRRLLRDVEEAQRRLAATAPVVHMFQ